MAPTSGGAAALATQLQCQAMDIAGQEIESLDIGAEMTVADMEAITAWGARMYLLGLGDRAAVARKAEAPAPAAPAIEWCQCGHQKSAHGAGRSGAPGHGACLASAMRGGRRRCSCEQYTWTSKAPAAAPAPAVQRRARRTDRREVAAACAASGHRTPGNDGQCACGTFALDATRAGGGR